MNETWIAHHGILGQKWGIRRFENKDGSLTEAGKKRYSKSNDQKKERFKNSIGIGGVFAGASLLKSAVSIALAKKGVEFASDGEFTVNPMKQIPKALVKAGKAFVLGKIIGYGVTSIRQDQKDKRSSGNITDDKQKQNSSANTKTDTPNNKSSNGKSFAQKQSEFMKTYKPLKGSPNSLHDIDDPDLIEMEIDDPDFRKEYGVSDSDYERWKKNVRK